MTKERHEVLHKFEQYLHPFTRRYINRALLMAVVYIECSPR